MADSPEGCRRPDEQSFYAFPLQCGDKLSRSISWCLLLLCAPLGFFCASFTSAYVHHIRSTQQVNIRTFVRAGLSMMCLAPRPAMPWALGWVCCVLLLAAWWPLVLWVDPLAAWFYAVVGIFLLTLAIVDARTGYLPDALTLPLLALGLFAAGFDLVVSLPQAAMGAGAGYGFMWLFNRAYRLARGPDGMGGGDMKLVAALGACGGWAPLPLIVAAACCVGVVFAVLRPGSDAWSRPLVFGPFLSAAGMVGLAAQAVVQSAF